MKVLVVMDPIESLNLKKDTSLALIQEAQVRGHGVFYLKAEDLFCKNGEVFGAATAIKINSDTSSMAYQLGQVKTVSLSDFDIILMRKDPPFDMNYLYATYLLELVEKTGTRVFNKPRALRDVNEKVFTQWFPEWIPQTLVSANIEQLEAFIDQEEDVVVKPLNEMGGRSVFHLEKREGPSYKTILLRLTNEGKTPIMAQRFIPDIYQTGDKRILIIAGQPVPYGLARFPKQGEFRGNLAAGGRGVPCELSDNEQAVARQLGAILLEKGLIFVGLDMIGGYLTEINVTSPTCLREIDQAFGLNSASLLWDWLER